MSDLLDIPPFLLNQKSVRKTTSFSDKQSKWSMPAKVDLPKGDWELYWVYVGNHSVLGSGRRLVYAWMGRKWSTLLSALPGTGPRCSYPHGVASNHRKQRKIND